MRRLLLSLVASFGFCGGASATLIDRGGGLIYDNVLNVVYSRDLSLAREPAR